MFIYLNDKGLAKSRKKSKINCVVQNHISQNEIIFSVNKNVKIKEPPVLGKNISSEFR